MAIPTTPVRVAAARSIKITPEVADYGVIRKGTRAVRQFEITNTTATPLSIVLALSTCRCLYYEYNAAKLPVNWKEALTITVDGSRANAGTLAEQIAVRSRDDPNATGTIMVRATILYPRETEAQPGVSAETYPDYLRGFIGTWENRERGGLLEISYVDNRLRIRDCAGPTATSGVEYFARYSNGEIIAVGDPHNFYKFQFPSFKILPNGELHIDCGDCVDAGGLKKSAKTMPRGIKYVPPVNDD
jgi:hypothetical protein